EGAVDLPSHLVGHLDPAEQGSVRHRDQRQAHADTAKVGVGSAEVVTGVAPIATRSAASARPDSCARHAAATKRSGRRKTTPMAQRSNQPLSEPSVSPTTRVPVPAYS